LGSAIGHIICLFGTKGGVGRSTIAVNLGVAFGLQGHSSVIVDMNFHIGVTDMMLGASPEKAIDGLIRAQDYENSGDYLTVYNENVSLLAPPARPELSLHLDSHGAAAILGALKPHFDFIVVDLPSSIANHVAGALETADFIGLVAKNDVVSVKNAVFALQSLALLGFDLQTIRLILNQFDWRGLTREEVEKAIGLPVFWRIDWDKKMLEAMNKSEPFILYDPQSVASQSLKRLALALAIEFGKSKGKK